ncbi:AmmeMemoRadiSam system radical SAM enzyme [Histomonas meleagridis]|uniref:AmmeMemoRadiSam system radical SAM enzyme n=1 Tax=Histomonas meleagridis TaxID=135588 RepID=UPI00355A10E9|nr:AmmeMemoRadiSam system radical SAM enzyme [Histomonas meleagridis]KAH0806038.1 AmmeMemoRadiSam system radical SAM enzyme [Histomonas meleagridis]
MQAFEESPLFKPLPNNEIQCLCCQKYCVIPPGKLGHCRARGNINGKPFSPVWGRYTVQIDPIEKKPLYHFLPGTKVYSYGTVGCNFSCQFCQNSSLSMWKLDIEDVKCLKQNDVGYLDYYTPEEMVSQAIKNGCKSIASTYNEPTISTEFSYQVFKLAKESGLHTVYVTNGFESVETLNYLGPYLDAVNIDLKSFREPFYQRICGAHLEGVCKTIQRCVAMGIHTEVTTLVIPGENDSDSELSDCANFIASIDKNIVWHLSAYHDDYNFHGRGVTPLNTLRRGAQIGRNAGIRFIYIGNVNAPEARLTKCPRCGKKLIDREWFSATVSMSNGRCECGEVIPGLFEDANNLPPKLQFVPENLLDIEDENEVNVNVSDNERGLVVYASKTGTSKDFAEKIAQKLSFEVMDMSQFTVDILSKLRFVVFCVSTYGRGAPPQSAKQFWNQLMSFNGELPNLKFAVFGCGSTSFPKTFVKFAEDLREKLLAMKCIEVIQIYKHDEMAEDEDENEVNGWIEKINFD